MIHRFGFAFLLLTQLTVFADADPERTPATALSGIDVAPDVEATLIGAEPMLLSPASIDVDHRGRIWVCEVVNYRRFANQNREDREEGDRILILKDTDGDGTLDHSTTFYQGRDIDGVQGICVLGNRVIAATPEKIYNLYDDNGDSKADRIELWFTADEHINHDHGMHAFTFGPDGRLYFNFGNAVKKLLRADNSVVTDTAGHDVVANRKPYQEGMAFRCELDGSNVETLGWNFRNNWELTVDSFGAVWQSDNDDDGNRSTRINYVMDGGNYGYKDEITGARWNQHRTGLEEEVHDRHWHQNDPGVVPNILVTGQGAPCGIEVYEADVLPERFRNQLVHCDAGVSVVRSYAVEAEGAGYRATINPLLTGSRDLWFRPCDVALAADGSLIVADWYDPGVGGHRQGDVDRGRLFRIAPQGHKWRHPTFDFSTIDGAIEGLLSSNREARYLAWQKLAKSGTDAEPALNAVFMKNANPRYRARALWLLGRLDGKAARYIDQAAHDENPDLRMTAIRLARQTKTQLEPTILRLSSDKSLAVRRECVIAVRDLPKDDRPVVWGTLVTAMPKNDRWYLEALGIAAGGIWDECLAALDDLPVSDALRDAVLWRSRGSVTSERIVERIQAEATAPTVDADKIARWFRALDFQDSQAVDSAVRSLLQPHLQTVLDGSILEQVLTETLLRLETVDSDRDPEAAHAFDSALKHVSARDFVTLVQRFRLKQRYPDLLKLVTREPTGDVARAAAQSLADVGQKQLLMRILMGDDTSSAVAVVTAMGMTRNAIFRSELLDLIRDKNADLEVRRAAVRSGLRIQAVGRTLVRLADSDGLSTSLTSTLAAAMHASPDQEFRDAARRLYPLPEGKEGEKLPELNELLERNGDAKNGRLVFNTTGTCHKCHVVNGIGRAVGPDLSEVGRKLSRQALFESVLFPSAGISHNYDLWTLVLANGTTVSGLLADETADSITIIDNEAVRLTYPMDDVDEKIRQSVSMMPADLQKIMSTKELIDVVSYMETLKEKRSDLRFLDGEHLLSGENRVDVLLKILPQLRPSRQAACSALSVAVMLAISAAI